MKLLTYIFSFAYFLTITDANTAVSGESGIVAIVNDKSILSSDLNYRVNFALKTSGQQQVTKAMLEQVRKDVLNLMIDETLQQGIIKKFDVKIEATELDSAWNMMEQRLGLSKGQLVGFLKENNIPERLIKEQVLASYGWQRYVHERYGKDVRVEDTEVKAEMAKLQKNKEKNQALLSEIVLNYSTPEQAEEAKRKATEVSAKIKSGTPFPLLAQQYSHSASAARGGDIGWVSIDEMDPEVKKAVQSTRRGEITSPVATQSGYRIFGIRDRHGVGSLGDSVEYVSFLQIDFQFPMFGGEEGQEETFIKANNIREEARTRSMMLKLTEGRPRIKTQNIENIQLDSLHPELIKVLSKLKPGDRSPLMNTGEGVIMFMMCDKKTVKPHEPTEEEIKNKLRETKFDAINSRELRALRREAFIEMR